MEGFQEPIERRIDRMTFATFAEANLAAPLLFLLVL